MTSEIRVNKLTNRIGLSTVTFADSGIGVTVTGRIDPDTDSARDLGTTSVRWRNAYVDTYYGDGSNLTGITGTTINNNATTKFITGTNNANELDCEANLSYNNSLVTFASSSLMVSKSTSPTISVKETAGNKEGAFRANTDGVLLRSLGNYPLIFHTNQTERAQIDGSGRFLIGTNSVYNANSYSNNLVIYENGDVGASIIGNNSNSNYSSLYFSDTSTVSRAYLESQLGSNGNFTIGNNGSGPTRFVINGAERMRLTGSGRFGIGTNSPDHIFEVEDNNSSVAVSRDGANAQLLFKSNSVAQAGQIQVAESSGGGAMQFFNKNTSGVLRECFRLSPTNRTVSFFASGPSYPAGSSHDEQFYQFANSYAYNYVMRLRNYTWGYGLRIDTDDDSTREGLMIYSTKSGVNQSKASIHMDGTYRSRNNTYTSYSDIKLKENIVDAESQWDDIKGLKVRNFNFKIDDPSQKMIGVIAQEAETVCPNLVRDIPDTEEKDGEIRETGTHTKEVKYSILYMKAIKALQEAMTRIETLEQDNIALRARITNLEGN